MSEFAPLRIALLAPFPIRMYYGDRLAFRTKQSSEHPASWVVNLVCALSEKPDVELHLVTLGSHLVKDYRFRKASVHYHFLKGGRYSLKLLTLYQLDRQLLAQELGRIDPDVVEAFGTENAYAYTGVTSGYPCVTYMQGIVSELIKQVDTVFSLRWVDFFITQFFERYTVKQGKHFIAENAFSQTFVRRLNSKASIYVIPNLINPLFFQVERDWTSTHLEILFVGSVSESKGALDLIEAFHHVCQILPQCHLRMIGPVNASNKLILEDYIARFGLVDSVTLAGLQNQHFIAEAMQRATVLVHPSWMDASPNSVMEAMVAGMPVVASRVGGIPDIIQDRETGLLVEPRNPAMLAEEVLFLLQNQKERNRLGKNARYVMRGRLDPARIVDELVSVYRRVASEQGRM